MQVIITPASRSGQCQVLAAGALAAFANPALYRVLAKEGYHYAIRITANAVLEREIEPLLSRPVRRPSRRPKVFYHSFQYQAASWHQPRRVVAKVEWHQGELFPRVGFIVTNLNKRAKNGGELRRKNRQMLDFFADSPILATSIAKWTPRTIETQWSIVVS